MSRAANVLSHQTLKDFKNTLITFGEEARNSLGGVDMELRRTRDWLERDQLGYWQAQVKRRNEELMQARSDLHRRKITQQGSDAVSDADQKEALREAQRRLRIAEEKVALIKKLIPYLQHEIAEYHSHSQPLGDHLAGGFERSVAGMERMILALEAYLATKVPTAPRHEPVESAAAPTAAGSSSTTSEAEPPGEATGKPAQQSDATTKKPAAGPAAASQPQVPAGETETLVSGGVS
jgi:hypothetical protein